MAFGQEIKDFVNAFAVGYKLLDNKEDRELEREYKKARIDYMRSYAGRLRSGGKEDGFDLDFWRGRSGKNVTLRGGKPSGSVERGAALPPPEGMSRRFSDVGDPAATDLEPHQMAFLNAIASGESGGRYNVRWGGPSGPATFDDFSRHPAIPEPGPQGPSTAAGRYQFTATTWNELGGGEFTPERQDHRAWVLAEQRYRAATGRDLGTDLQEQGLTPEVLEALSPTWPSLSIRPNQRIAVFNDSLSRYMGGNTHVADAGALYNRGGAVERRRAIPSLGYAGGGAVPRTRYYANGGAVEPTKYYADGGFVEGDELPSQALPVTSEGNKDEDAELPGEVRNPFSIAYDAVRDGLIYSAESLGLTRPAAVNDPNRQRAQMAYVTGYGAANRGDIEDVENLIDPKREMSDSERTLRVLGSVYDYYVSRGEYNKAKEAAASLVQAYRIAYQRYAAVAKAAAMDGDIDGAIKAAVLAYVNVPDGRDLQIKKVGEDKYQAIIKDVETGKVITKDILNPAQIGAMAMQISPENFDEFLLSAAGVRQQEKQGNSPAFDAAMRALEVDEEGNLPDYDKFVPLFSSMTKEEQERFEKAYKGIEDRMQDRKRTAPDQRQSRVDEAVLEFQNLFQDKWEEVPASDRTTMQSAAVDLMDGGMTAADAAFSVTDILNEAEKNWTAGKNRQGDVVIRWNDGREGVMSESTFRRLNTIRERRLAEFRKKQAEQEATAKRRKERWDQIWGNISEAWSNLTNAVSPSTSRAAPLTPDFDNAIPNFTGAGTALPPPVPSFTGAGYEDKTSASPALPK